MAKKDEKKNNGSETKKGANVFADGLTAFTPHEKAPDWVLANLKINPKKLFKWCQDNKDKLGQYKDEPQLSLVVKKGQDGKVYATVDTYGTAFAESEKDSDDLPF